MVTIVGVVFYFGIVSTILFLSLAGVICIDELLCNFLKEKRFGLKYWTTQIVFAGSFLYLELLARSVAVNDLVVNLAVILNMIMLVYLFFIKMDGKTFIAKVSRGSVFISFFLLLPFISLSSLLFYPDWIKIVAILLLVNFGMDTGAWFFGKNFGKRKLWPSISPNKTVEGLIGGALTSSVIGCLAWYYLIDENIIYKFSIFFVLGILSQLGDLIQSKLKRQSGIKDSSSLIPGHGGVYDRIDSLVFLSPFFALFMRMMHS